MLGTCPFTSNLVDCYNLFVTHSGNLFGQLGVLPCTFVVLAATSLAPVCREVPATYIGGTSSSAALVELILQFTVPYYSGVTSVTWNLVSWYYGL